MQIFFKNKNKNQSIRIIKAKKEKERKCTNYPRLEKKKRRERPIIPGEGPLRVRARLLAHPRLPFTVYPRAPSLSLALGDDSATTAALHHVPRSSSGSVPPPATSTHQVCPPPLYSLPAVQTRAPQA